MYFEAVASTLNFRQAAQRLNITQPTLTLQINSLEQQIGFQLFERSRSGTLLSAQGRELLPLAKKVLEASDALLDTANWIKNGPVTTFKIGIPPTLGPYLLPWILPELHKQYHELKLYVREAAPKLLEQQLLNGEFDLILSSMPTTSDELTVQPLFNEPVKFVVPADHPLAAQDDVAASQISGESVLTLEEHHYLHTQVRDICEQFGAHLMRDFEGTSLDTLRQMTVMGLGVAFLPGLYIHSEMHRPEALHVCELRDNDLSRNHALIWRSKSPSRIFFRELAGKFNEIIKEKLSNIVTVID
ncbi:hydrogen peroxide-inducible genes activator [Endozoicomonas sp. G2_1]|uniref:hydrogen peroxide-inducible genes activator n=1 Tax=Endozoicomonas sp. G2_1 TaxID=2821091 RepID=UPI0032AFFC1B